MSPKQNVYYSKLYASEIVDLQQVCLAQMFKTSRLINQSVYYPSQSYNFAAPEKKTFPVYKTGI